jgi:hypothetical protein
MSAFAKIMHIPKALKVLQRAGVGRPPIKGDEVRTAKRRVK